MQQHGLRDRQFPDGVPGGGEAERVRLGRLPDGDDGDEHEGGCGVGHDHVLEPGPHTDRVLLLEDDQEVGADGHELPEDEEEEPVRHTDDPDDAGEEEQKQGVVSDEVLVRVARHVGYRIQGGEGRDHGDDEQEEGAQLIHPERQRRAYDREIHQGRRLRRSVGDQHRQRRGEDEQAGHQDEGERNRPHCAPCAG